MPLVIPDIAATGTDNGNQNTEASARHDAGDDSQDDSQQALQRRSNEWLAKLAGKTVKDEPHSEINFCKRDLPQGTRVLPPGSIVTMDWKPNRLNVHLGEEGEVSHVTHG